MQAYIAISYNKKEELQPALDCIKTVLRSNFIEPLVFTEQYNFLPAQEKEMMHTAFAAIDNCDLLIAEVSDKAIGIGVEAGYAKAKNKKIIYLRHKDAEHSTTMSGTCDYLLVYFNMVNLETKLDALLKEIALS